MLTKIVAVLLISVPRLGVGVLFEYLLIEISN